MNKLNKLYTILNKNTLTPANKIVAYHNRFGYPVYDENSFKPITQKAKSIINGIRLFEQEDMNKYVPIGEPLGEDYDSKLLELIQHSSDIDMLPPQIWTSGFDIFARPCPLKPRHGFVDSRIIKSKKELKDLLSEVKSADPKGEIILSSFIEANYSAVLCNNGSLSIGPGHDGATSGYNSICFPIAPVKICNKVRVQSGLSSNSTVFIEAVYKKLLSRSDKCSSITKKSFHITQLRGGPKVDSINDFIPNKITVKQVVVPCYDLLKWEYTVKKLSPGTVVYGKGHTLTSHAGIHCVINNVPFITTFEPQVGQIIKPINKAAFKLDKKLFLLGITSGLYSNLTKRKMLHFSATVLHNWSYLSSSEHSSWLLGLVSVYMSKILCALSYGEYRHCNYKPLKIKSNAEFNRSSIYNDVMNYKNFSLYIKNAFKIKKEFTMKSKFKRGYGGKLWANAIKHSINIWNLIVDIQDSKTSNTVICKKLISTINKSVNLVHNNGWLFNKISESAAMEKIAASPGLAALELGDIFYEEYLKIKSKNKIKKILKVKAI